MQTRAVITEQYVRALVDAIGMEAYLKLVEMFGGTSLYVPSAKTRAVFIEKWLKGGVHHAGQTANIGGHQQRIPTDR
jgi:hypothetical protein